MAKQVLNPFFYAGKDGKLDQPERWVHFYLDPTTKVIYFLKSHVGKKVKFSTHCKYDPPNVDEAIKAKRFANAEFDRRTGKKTKHVRSLIREELAAWERLKESEGHKYDTMNNIRRARKQIEEFWGARLPNEINRDSFAEWCAWWKEKHADIRMENAIKYFNNFCRYLHEKVVQDRPLLPSLIRFRDPDRHEIEASRELKKERIFTYDEFKRVHEAAASPDDALVIHIMYTMATRIDETLKLDFGGRVLLDTDPPVYRWYSGNNKAKRVGEHGLHPSLIGPLKALRARRMAEKTFLLFPQKIDNQKPMREQQIDWDAWRKRADLGWHWTPHTFKHTCLTILFNDPKNPHAVICKQYRTSLQVALKHYVKVTRESMLAIREAIEVSL